MKRRVFFGAMLLVMLLTVNASANKFPVYSLSMV